MNRKLFNDDDDNDHDDHDHDHDDDDNNTNKNSINKPESIFNKECGQLYMQQTSSIWKSNVDNSTWYSRTSVAHLNVWTRNSIICILAAESVCITEIRNLWNNPTGKDVFIGSFDSTLCTDWLDAQIWVRLIKKTEI